MSFLAMPRLADYCAASSGDEILPLRDLNQIDARIPSRLVTRVADEQKLVPKGVVTSSARKIRRLGGGTWNATNPLFQPWNVENVPDVQAPPQVSLRGSPRKRQMITHKSRVPEISQPDPEHDSPLLPAHLSCITRPKAEQEFHDEAADAELIEAQLSLESETRDLPPAGNGSQNSFLDGDGCVAIMGAARPQLAAETENVILLSDSDEEPSVDQTAAQDTSENIDGSASEFELDNSFDESQEEIPQSRSITSYVPIPARGLSTREACRKEFGRRRQTVAREDAGPIPSTGATQIEKALQELEIHDRDSLDDDSGPHRGDGYVLPSTPRKAHRPGSLASPDKLANIPKTPHRPSIDALWSQGFIDAWNERHLTTHPIQPPPADSLVKRTPAHGSPTKVTKKLFDAKKRLLAEDFFRELDMEITHGKIAGMVESTGGVKLTWSRTLNTTAGRANWRRETTRTKSASGTLINVVYKHHASIELAEKIIDSEDRLFNVLAHEFCHLASFMVSGVTNNPHGKEFKAWAAQCSSVFGESRGIRVTTKHTYEIDFKYVWVCLTCASEYKRHSKSIDPQRHRCGGCESALVQTKPVPRCNGAAGRGMSRLSDWQVFVKAQMKAVKQENPAGRQKDVMRVIAERWVEAKKALVTTAGDVSLDVPSSV